MARQHGERTTYVHEHCRCVACCHANRTYAAVNEMERRLGQVDLIDPAPVREHLLALSAEGVGYKQAALIARVSVSSTFKVVSGRSKRVRMETAARLVSVLPSDVAPGAYIDAAPTWVHVRALLEQGYPKSWIGWHIGQGGKALQLGKTKVTKRNADAIAELRVRIGDQRYDERSDSTVEDEIVDSSRRAALMSRRKTTSLHIQEQLLDDLREEVAPPWTTTTASRP